ncbi:N-acetylglucosamine-1-phosphotransferase subunit gamma-like isoform X2 [Homarus americanus]|uniref:N-acetylglucosamine-1-phosphotransferase subunit gamma-like isoform X2 n=1 Tax=Homarus americanus TaxID=6706 RepID=UPI001C43A1CD|nr:N-acetylglucosamine-1-phosphotransferase subunit gamma-like isoform X2 [Homarus americanus]
MLHPRNFVILPKHIRSRYNNLQKLDSKAEEKLQLRMKPANFTGPGHLKDLVGRCFKHRDLKYEYVFCPFQNLTQEDIQTYYEPYKGVLGVWADWIIEDGKFKMMNMIEGSPCGNGMHRSTKITLQCGPSSELVSVSEPDKCRYLAKFETPDVCGENALVVYPRLPAELRQRWDDAEQDLHTGLLTKKGYHKELERIFLAASYYLSPDMKSSLVHKAATESSKTCKVELEEARLRITELEEELRLKEEIILELGDGKRE